MTTSVPGQEGGGGMRCARCQQQVYLIQYAPIPVPIWGHLTSQRRCSEQIRAAQPFTPAIPGGDTND